MAKMKMAAGPPSAKPPQADSPQQPRAVMPMPPPAKMPPGITRGSPPLPAGRPVAAINPQRLTAMERTNLQQLGWREGQPIPANMADILAEASQYMHAEIVAGREQLPVDPATPAVQLVESPSGTPLPSLAAQSTQEWLPPQPQQPVQAQPTPYEQLLQQHAQRMQQPKTQPANPVAAAIAAKFEAQPQAGSEVSQRIDAAKRLNIELGEPERPPTRHTLDPNETLLPVAEVTAATNRTTEPVAPLTHCPHCAWDLRQPDDPPPDDKVKQAYLACVLGSRPFVQEISLLGGNLIVTLRTLTFRELDAVFRQVYADAGRGEIRNEMENWEQANRYRMALQVIRVRTSRRDDETPEGLCPKDNASARDHWAQDDDEEPLRRVSQTVFGEMLGDESSVRIIRRAVDRFNRTVARLEALADNSDFWKATGQQS